MEVWTAQNLEYDLTLFVIAPQVTKLGVRKPTQTKQTTCRSELHSLRMRAIFLDNNRNMNWLSILSTFDEIDDCLVRQPDL